MVFVKDKPEYTDLNADFKPLPRYGHYSEATPEWEAIAPVLRAGMDQMWAISDFPTMRKLVGNPDAVMPPGGPDRYKEVNTELTHFPARDGHMVELKVYKSPTVKPDATCVYRMHGGGTVIGSHEVDGVENVYAAMNPNVIVISVDYRLAPENPFPRPVFDAYDGLLWVKENAKTLGINPEKLIVAGSSAGANIAPVVALMARDNGITGLIAQVLHFPPACHPKFFPSNRYEFGSFVQNADNAVLTTARAEAFSDAHIPNAEPDWRHSPLLAPSHANLPPTLIQCGGLDIFRDGAFAYADALRDSGVDVEIYCYKGVGHCFPAVGPTLPETPVFYERFTTFLKKFASGP
ncbi:alpha/beta-hydrolase [Xylaria longipes]|nr:alpha/beta-hydrolase [Xylaria longipes]